MMRGKQIAAELTESTTEMLSRLIFPFQRRKPL